MFILVYPVGIPLFLLYTLYSYRERLMEPGVRVQIGFLYEVRICDLSRSAACVIRSPPLALCLAQAYNTDLWWFEMVDMIHKLSMTCILFFWPPGYQMPFGMVKHIMTQRLLVDTHSRAVLSRHSVRCLAT